MNRNKHPNIFFAIADDASHFSAYGHKFVNTPNFDRVAREGILFNNAFTSNPKCAPSRASILTGKHTWQLEEACNHFSLFPAKITVYPDLLEDSGYQIGYCGKGWAPGDLEKSGRTRNPAGVVYNNRSLKPPANTKISKCDYTANFIDFLDERPADKPFYFWYGGREPHRKYIYGEGTRAGKNLDDIDEVPPYWPDDEIIRNDMLDYASEIEWFDKQLGQMLEIIENKGELDNTLIIVTSDNGAPFPRIKGQMYDDDFRLPLAICWKNRIKTGRFVDDLISFIDIAPTILETAGIKIPADMEGKSLINIFQSDKSGFIDPARDRAYMGKERHDLGRVGDVGYPVRCIRTPEYLYVKNYRPDLWPAGNPETNFTNCDESPSKTRIRQLHAEGKEYHYQFCFGKRPTEELFRIKTDPHCIENLADKPEYKNIKKQLCRELEKKLKETNDPRILGNKKIFDSYIDVRNKHKSWKAYMEKLNSN